MLLNAYVKQQYELKSHFQYLKITIFASILMNKNDGQKWRQLASFQAFFEFLKNRCLFGSPSPNNGGIPCRHWHKEHLGMKN